MAHFVNAAVLLSAWSAAASDVYISSRFLFFLARCRHAPQIFASLFRYPSGPQDSTAPDSVDEGDDVLDISDVHIEVFPADDDDGNGSCDENEKARRMEGKSDDALGVRVEVRPASEGSGSVEDVSTVVPTPAEPEPGQEQEQEHEHSSDGDIEGGPREKKPWFVLPLFAVLGSASVGLLAFLNSSGAGAEAVSVYGSSHIHRSS